MVKIKPKLGQALSYLVDSSALDSKSVLIDCDDLAVLQNGLVVRLDSAQVNGHEQRCRENGPHCHLGLRLLVA